LKFYSYFCELHKFPSLLNLDEELDFLQHQGLSSGFSKDAVVNRARAIVTQKITELVNCLLNLLNEFFWCDEAVRFFLDDAQCESFERESLSERVSTTNEVSY
jgi:hypothetical protein